MNITDQLLKELNKNPVEINNDGALVIDYWVRELSPILLDSLNFKKDIPYEQQRHITWQVIKQHGLLNKKFTKDSIGEIAKAFRGEYYSKPINEFIIATNISLNSYVKLRKINDSTVMFSNVFPRKIQRAREGFKERALHSLYVNELPRNYTCVRIKVKARCEYSAMQNALNSIDLLRGIWNFSKNRQTGHRSSSHQQPVNSIILGPVHTLHLMNGDNADAGLFWYEPLFLYQVDPINLTTDMINTEKDIRRTLSKLGADYSEKIAHFIREYCRALDNTDHHKSFLALWSTFEMVTGTDDYNKAIRRALFSIGDREYHQQIFEGLRSLRNKIAHTNHQLNSIESRLYQLKRYVECLIEIHLHFGKSCEDITEAWEIMDMNPDKGVLLEKLNRYKKAYGILYK